MTIDAALKGEGKYAGKAYFFKGDQYLRYDWNIDAVDPGYPLPIAGNWPGIPDSIARGIDAALNGEGKYAGKAYFFKEGQYLRYDWNIDAVDSGYPLPIAGNWTGMPDSFSRGIDAALNGEGKYAGKAYFFKGDQYLRYDWNIDAVDSGYPLPIAGNWPGLEGGSGQILGKLSEKYETGGRGPGVISGGTGDPGGVSYGCYQMTSKPNGGTVKAFVSQPDFRWRQAFSNLTPGTPDFSAKWKEIANTYPEDFREVQHTFIRRTHFDPCVARIESNDNLDVTKRSHTLQDVIWSTAVQHGPNNQVVHNSLQALGVSQNDPEFDKKLIHAIYAERGRKDENGVLVYFRNSSPEVQKGVANRYVSEEKDALKMLENE